MSLWKAAASLAFMLVLLSSSSASVHSAVTPAAPSGGDWTSFTFDDQNSRYNSLSTITRSNAHTLVQKWFFETDFAITSTPLVENGVAYFADWGGNVYAVKLADHSLNWTTNVGFAISSTLALSNGLVYAAGGP